MKTRNTHEPFQLRPDWSYSAPYQIDRSEPKGHTSQPDQTRLFIHAYNDLADERKRQFLKDARRYLAAVGEELRRYGFERPEISVNPAGIACSGDAYADFKHPGHERWIHLNISETGVDILGEAPPIGIRPLNAFTTRHDRICIMGRWHGPPPRKGWSDVYGPNNWYDANLDARELARQIIRLLEIEETPHPLPTQTSLFGSPATA